MINILEPYSYFCAKGFDNCSLPDNVCASAYFELFLFYFSQQNPKPPKTARSVQSSYEFIEYFWVKHAFEDMLGI